MSIRDAFRGPEASIDDQVESFATDRVPADKRWPIPAISLVLLGNATAMFFFTFGAQQSFLVGWPMMLLPIGYFFFGAILIGALTMRVASREGLSQSLLSRGLGFGRRGAAVASFIYAINFVYYFLFEGTIVSHAIAYYFDIEIHSLAGIGIFALVGLATIAFVWRGMYAMSALQKWGFPLFVGLLIWALINLDSMHDIAGFSAWESTATGGGAALWTAMSLANGQMIFQGLIATDYGRFASRGIRYRGTGTIMLLELVPMFTIIFLGAMLGASLVGAFGEDRAQDPGFVFVHLMGLVGVFFVVITQIRINVMNLYGGSIVLSSGVDAATGYRPGRPWWMFAVWLFGVVFYATDVISNLGTFLAITGVLTNTWVLIILADYFVCRRWLKLGRAENIEFREGEVREWNPCGLVSLGIAVFAGALGIVGVYPVAYASFIAMFLGPITHVAMTTATKGRYYTPVAGEPVSEPATADR
ncbi:purine-cytosine permease family protein [Streptomyces sp. TP-A0874]|uniref:purine-cytosine permease family protein n=1 Tax=Streptomyces sp. TP-A0874 TaxID=549819 RepID=UPI000853A3C8|nr:allantoin permease [Streptomyces sp. TP-A0874]